ncbi:uncharacterized protein [Lepeophtheirus salmonis]|uniref:uncharacterized protein n=1 Tax=Lepeophtheirus salmonis TaxID=72036 RepID=UPI001AE2345F|nr:uncharacterized protein LOC121118579 [Lepeophtheirus salmonis]
MILKSLKISVPTFTFLVVILSTSFVEAQRVLQSTFGNKQTYEFGYTVDKPKFKNDFGHYESKREDGIVRGQYHVLLPDGRVQLVVYYADETGYHPTITYLSLNDWNLIKGGRLSLPLLRTRLRQNIPLNSLNSRNPPIRTLDPSSNNIGIPNRRPNNPRIRNSLSSGPTSSPFGTTSSSRFNQNIRGRVTTNNPSTRFPTRTPFSNRISTTSSTIRPNLVNSRGRFSTSPSRFNDRPNRFIPSTVLPNRNSQSGSSSFSSNRGAFNQNGDNDDLLFNGRGNSRFRASTTRPFRRNIATQIRNIPSSNKSPFYFDNTI